MRCAACDSELEAFTGDVCPQCQHFAHPTKLGIYDGLELIRRGGMGSVYRARHPELGTVVAIKTVHTHTGPETLAERFEQEAKLAARIPHPGVVHVFDYDCQEGRLYLVMEFVEGETLRVAIEDDKRDIAWRLDKIAQLADILHAAHERGIVHRDVKPENVMVDSTGRVRVLDFGISRVLDDGERMTQTGEILGTPEYISPEQILDVPEAIDARTDVYATGVVLYELLTGRSPFAGNNLFAVLKNVESLDPPPPSELRPGIPEELDALVMACIAKDKDQRPVDCRTLARRVRELTPTGIIHHRASRTALVAIALLFTVLGWGLAQWWPGKETSATETAGREPSPAQAIRTVLEAPPPHDRSALATATRNIPDDAEPEDLYWRGMAHKNTGALFLALRDFEAARDAGFAPAREHAAVCWAYKHKLYPLLLDDKLLLKPCKVEIDGDDAFARFIENLAGNTQGELTNLQGIDKSVEFDCGILWNVLHDKELFDLDLIDSRLDYVPKQLCDMLKRGVTIDELERVMGSIDRTAPMRYFLEAVIAVRMKNPARLRAALELAQVAGEADFAMTVYVSQRMGPNEKFDERDKVMLKQMADELTGPHADALRAKVKERLQ